MGGVYRYEEKGSVPHLQFFVWSLKKLKIKCVYTLRVVATVIF